MSRKNEEFRVLAGLSGNLTEAVGYIPTVGGRQSDYNQTVQSVIEDIADVDFDEMEGEAVSKMIAMLENFDTSKLTGQTRRDYEDVLSQLKDIEEGMRRVKAVTRTGRVIKMQRRTVVPGAERMANKKRTRKNRAKAKIDRKKMARRVDRGERKRAMLQKESLAGKLHHAIQEAATLSGHEEIMKRIQNVFSMINYIADDHAVQEQLDTLYSDLQDTIIEGVSEETANGQYVKALKAIQVAIKELGVENF